jgi:hypothetical protein
MGKMIISIGIVFWKDVNSSKKDACIFYSYLYIFLDTKHFSSVIRALFCSDYSFFWWFEPLFCWIYIFPLTLYVYFIFFFIESIFPLLFEHYSNSDYAFFSYFKRFFPLDLHFSTNIVYIFICFSSYKAFFLCYPSIIL